MCSIMECLLLFHFLHDLLLQIILLNVADNVIKIHHFGSKTYFLSNLPIKWDLISSSHNLIITILG